ncbi:DUF2971 domain-containing protein [Paraburkholderia fungorum]|jgi:hypothetical protein|uniref:DUF2971 domain-containing protein n=1 Tax=Paraburkholderia fungorum TaxID=134537 RepID=UPI000480CEC4|nr:DUF2971 domain-containing protein [Paraburkholderia fungorum]MBB5547000.1 hypothetical protein [Paraburkholderia fungorum]
MTIIYHYCDATAFISIIDKAELWLSNTRKMNDVSEVLLVEEVVLGRVGQHAKNGDISSEMEQEIRIDYELNKANAFVCSFSREADSTIQWKSYADQGRGFALGFDAKALWRNSRSSWRLGHAGPFYSPRRASPVENMLALTNVLYFGPREEEHLLGKVDSIIGAAKGVNLSVGITDLILDTASICKDVSFKHEKEQRLVFTPLLGNGTVIMPKGSDGTLHLQPLMEMKWRTVRHGVTSYFAFPFAKGALTQVWLGPVNPDHIDHTPQASERLLETFLQARGYSAEVIHSKSPYRG